MHWTSGRAYSQDLRDRVLAAVDAGEAVRAVAPRFGVSISYVYKAVIRRRQCGEVAARTSRGRPPRKLAAHERAVEAFMRARQDATLADLRRHLLEAHGIAVSLGAAWRTVRRLGLSLKKSPARSRAGPPRRRPRAKALAAVAALPRP
jgi:transposase